MGSQTCLGSADEAAAPDEAPPQRLLKPPMKVLATSLVAAASFDEDAEVSSSSLSMSSSWVTAAPMSKPPSCNRNAHSDTGVAQLKIRGLHAQASWLVTHTVNKRRPKATYIGLLEHAHLFHPCHVHKASIAVRPVLEYTCTDQILHCCSGCRIPPASLMPLSERQVLATVTTFAGCAVPWHVSSGFAGPMLSEICRLIPEPVLPAMMRSCSFPEALLGALRTSMSWARVFGTAQVCPAPLTCLMVPAAALFCKHVHRQHVYLSCCLQRILQHCSIQQYPCSFSNARLMPCAQDGQHTTQVFSAEQPHILLFQSVKVQRVVTGPLQEQSTVVSWLYASCSAVSQEHCRIHTSQLTATLFLMRTVHGIYPCQTRYML